MGQTGVRIDGRHDIVIAVWPHVGLDLLVFLVVVEAASEAAGPRIGVVWEIEETNSSSYSCVTLKS